MLTTLRYVIRVVAGKMGITQAVFVVVSTNVEVEVVIAMVEVLTNKQTQTMLDNRTTTTITATPQLMLEVEDEVVVGLAVILDEGDIAIPRDLTSLLSVVLVRL